MSSTSLAIRLIVALLAAVAFAAAYGAVSSLIPILVIKVLLLAFFVVVGYAVFQSITGPIGLTLPIAALTGALAAWAMWIGWFWVAEGRAVALTIAGSGPRGLLKWIMAELQGANFTLTRRGTTTTIGPTMLGILWAGQTLMFALAPPAGVIAARWFSSSGQD